MWGDGHASTSSPYMRMTATEKQITHGPGGRVLTNTGVWSPDSQWIVYDTRPDAAGEVFEGTRIERVNIQTGQVETLYTSKNGACCGVATCSPVDDRVVFILGPENPTPDWSYGPSHRQGVMVHAGDPGRALNLDARDLTPPFTAGALRGGSHVHVFSPDGQWVSFTYQDHVLSQFKEETADHDNDLRTIGVSVPGGPVVVDRDHPRNHDGQYFSVLVAKVTAHPRPGSDEIQKAFEEGWVGTHGYQRPDGTWQRRALAFQGHVVDTHGQVLSEVFIADLPANLTEPGMGPLAGTAARRPLPPKGVVQRRLTYTADRPYPGIQGPRHWLRSSPDGGRIACLMKDDKGVVQLWTVSPHGKDLRPLTANPHDVASAFTWSPDGKWIAFVMDNSVCVCDATSGETIRLTERADSGCAPRPEACVFSPDGCKIAYVRRVEEDGRMVNQVFVSHLKK